MNVHAESSAVPAAEPRRRRLAPRRKQGNPYLDWLRAELGSIADGLDVDPLRKRYLQSRYVNQVVWMEGKAEAARRNYVRLRLITVVGAVIVPVLVGLNSDDGGVEAAAIGLSLIVAVSAAIEQFFHFGERWQHYRRSVERLKAEGWRYFELTDGSARARPTRRVPGLRAPRRGDPSGRNRHLHQRGRRRASTGAGPAGGLMAAGPAYAAFISYSRAVDGRLAPRLESALERFGKPWYRMRAVRVFRDDASLSANPGLWSSLTGALERAEFFVLLASPGASASEWVGKEVEYWLEHRDRARLLLVLTEGEIAWDDQAEDFDWERTTALPRALAGAYPEEPRYTDLRFAARSEHLSLRDPRFRDAVADVAAPLNGRAKDDMIGEEVRQHRRTLRIARGAGVALAALTAAASVAAVLAIRAADRADRERDRAEQEARVATSRQLAAQSAVAVRDSRLGGALTQAVKAWRTEHTSQARDALLAALKAAPQVVAVLPGRRAQEVIVSADGRRAALRSFDPPVVQIVDLATGRAAGTPVEVPIDAALALGPAAAQLAIGGLRGRVELMSLARGTSRTLTGPVRLRQSEHTAPVDSSTLPVGAGNLTFAPDGRVLAWAGPRAFVSLWDGRRVRRLRPPTPPGPSGWTVAVGDGGRVVAANGAATGEIVVWRVGRTGARARLLPGRPPVFGAVEAGQHGPIAIGAGRRPLLAVGGFDDGKVDVRDARSGERLHQLRTGRGAVSSLRFSPSGRVLSVVDAAGLTLWRAATGARLARFPPAGAERGAAALDDARIVALGADGSMTVRDLRAAAHQIARPLHGAEEYYPPMAFDPSGEHVASLDRRSRVRLWRISDGRRGPPRTTAVDASRLAFLPDGRLVTCCGATEDVPARVWSADGAARVVAGETGASYDMTVTSRGQLVVAGTTRRRAAVWGVGDVLELPRGTFGPTLSPDGRWVAAYTDEDASIWDVERRRKAAAYPPAEPGGVFSPDGRLLAAASQDGSIGLFDPRTGRKVGALGSDIEVPALAFSPDGRVLAALVTRTGTSYLARTTLELWDVAGRRPVGDEVLLDLGDATIALPALAFSPDGSRLAASGIGSQPLVLDLDADRWAERACALAPSCGPTPSTAELAARG